VGRIGDPSNGSGLTLAVELFDCPPYRARLTPKGCRAFKASGREECAACPGVVEIAKRAQAQRREIAIAPRTKSKPSERGLARISRKIGSASAHSKQLGRAQASVARRRAAESVDESPPAPADLVHPAEELAPMPKKNDAPALEHACDCGESFATSRGLARHRFACKRRSRPGLWPSIEKPAPPPPEPSVVVTVTPAPPAAAGDERREAVTRALAWEWRRELEQLRERATELERLLGAAKTLGLVD
jgi:hypothetical protein